MRRCTQCIMPETVPGLSFAEDGRCAFCQEQEPPSYRPESELEDIIASCRDRGGKYDCLVPVSGGRDSTFVLYMAKREYGLKVLAVCYDNEFQPQQTAENLRNACSILNVDLLVIRSKRGISRRVTSHRVRDGIARGVVSLGGAPCMACTYGFTSAAYMMADKYRVPLILWGSSATEGTQDRLPVMTPKRAKLASLLSPRFYLSELARIRQRIEFPAPGNPIFSRAVPSLKSDVTQETRLFDYVPWERKRIKDTIQNELGWKKPPGAATTWRSDCDGMALKMYCSFQLVGCSAHCFGYTNMISSGQMTRQEALAQEEEMARTRKEKVGEFLDKLGVPKEDVTKFLVAGDKAASDRGISL